MVPVTLWLFCGIITYDTGIGCKLWDADLFNIDVIPRDTELEVVCKDKSQERTGVLHVRVCTGMTVLVCVHL